MKAFKICTLFSLILLPLNIYAEEVRFSGFAKMVGGYTLEEDRETLKYDSKFADNLNAGSNASLVRFALTTV